MLCRGGVLLFVAVCVGAYDYYDDLRRMDYKNEVMYQDDSSNEDNILQPPNNIALDDLSSFNIIKLLQDGDPRLRYRSNFYDIENGRLSYPPPLGEIEVKGAVVKKQLPETKVRTNVVKVKPAPRPRQRKWRIKRPPGLCLLKLCGPIFKYTYE